MRSRATVEWSGFRVPYKIVRVYLKNKPVSTHDRVRLKVNEKDQFAPSNKMPHVKSHMRTTQFRLNGCTDSATIVNNHLLG